MNLYLDTNVLERKNLASDVELGQVAAYCGKYGGKIYLCTTVVIELIHHRHRDVRKVEQTISDLGRTYYWLTQSQLGDKIVSPFDAEQRIRQIFAAEPQIEIVSNDVGDVEHAVNAMYTGRKPSKPLDSRRTGLKKEVEAGDYKTDRDGIKDVLIWRAFLNLVRQHSMDHFVFISANTSDFAESASKNSVPMSFHLDLRNDLGGGLERATYIKNLSDFLRLHVDPIGTFEVTAALELLRQNPDVMLQMFADADLGDEAVLTSVTSLSDTTVHGFGQLGCRLYLAVEPSQGELTISLTIAVQVAFRDEAYTLMQANLVT